MQNIIGKCLRLRSTCRCPSCSTTNVGTALHRHGSNLRLRRKVGFAEIFTAMYSSTLAAAIVLDGTWKDAKRSRLDEKIAEAKTALDTTDKELRRRLEALGISEQECQDALAQEEEREGQQERDDEGEIQGFSFCPSESLPSKFSKSHKMAHRQRTSLVGGELYDLLLGPSHRPPPRKTEEVWDQAPQPPTNILKLHANEASAAQLVYRLILTYLQSLEVNTQEWPETIAIGVPDGETALFSKHHTARLEQKLAQTVELQKAYQEYPWRRVRETGRGTQRLISYPNCTDALNCRIKIVKEATRAQNLKLADLFSQRLAPDVLISRLCSQLLSQTFPLDIHSYNIMLIHLCRLGLFRFATAVVKVMSLGGDLYNEVTHAAMLNLFSMTSDPFSFRAYVSRMSALFQDGFDSKWLPHWRLPQNYSPIRSSGFKSFRRYSRKVGSSGEIVDSSTLTAEPAIRRHFVESPKNAEVYEALIKGCLQLGDFDRALLELSAMIKDGVQPSIEILASFLQFSVVYKNWQIGRTIWERMKTVPARLRRTDYYWMLELCVRCKKIPQFGAILREGGKSGLLRSRLFARNFGSPGRTAQNIVNRALAVNILEQNVWTPQFDHQQWSDLISAEGERPDMPNLHMEMTVRLLDLVDRMVPKRGYYIDSHGWAAGARKELEHGLTHGWDWESYHPDASDWIRTIFSAGSAQRRQAYSGAGQSIDKRRGKRRRTEQEEAFRILDKSFMVDANALRSLPVPENAGEKHEEMKHPKGTFLESSKEPGGIQLLRA